MPPPKPAVSMMVVEDEAITLEVIAVTLAKKYPDVAIHKAVNGRTGLELFKKHSPDIVITDINMPELSGVQMTKKIIEIKPDTKFIVLTGDNGKLTVGDSFGNVVEIDHVIDKPVDLLDLFAAVEQCLGEIMR
ncbi:MAG: response regulator [Oryzomonas sp.]|uniref:response regulator transcription factor n=1 Tax=Oryzomonas sp. TaxID=2855186 RepID=UPI0028406B6B|nr:response regulator [Oryzomonas sp.]MDR3580477.1 response regulator [Oryzomonas sp.]